MLSSALSARADVLPRIFVAIALAFVIVGCCSFCSSQLPPFLLLFWLLVLWNHFKVYPI